MTSTLDDGRLSTLRRQLAEGEQVDAFGVGPRRTRVVRTGPGRYLWCTSSDRSGGGRPRASVPAMVGLPQRETTGIVTPSEVDGELVYRVYGAQPLATWLRAADRSVADTATEAFDTLLPALAALHRLPSSGASTPPGLRRLTPWLDGAGPVGSEDATSVAQLRDLARDRWGEAGLGQLADWSRELTDPATRVHGGLSTSVIVPGMTEGPTVVLAEPAPSTGMPELDLGWLLGELIERRALQPTRADADLFRGLQRAVLRAYPGGWRADLVAAAAALRIATHARDFAAYVGWNAGLVVHIGLCRALIAAIRSGNRPFLDANVFGSPTDHKGW